MFRLKFQGELVVIPSYVTQSDLLKVFFSGVYAKFYQLVRGLGFIFFLLFGRKGGQKLANWLTVNRIWEVAKKYLLRFSTGLKIQLILMQIRILDPPWKKRIQIPDPGHFLKVFAIRIFKRDQITIFLFRLLLSWGLFRINHYILNYSWCSTALQAWFLHFTTIWSNIFMIKQNLHR